MHCPTCLDNAEMAYEARQEADRAIRCDESGHRPAFRRGVLVGRQDRFDAVRRAYRTGRHHGATAALGGVVLLVAGAWAMRRRGER